MFDVLVYLYENYWRPDACPDRAQLSRKLVAVGFEREEIDDALRWLGGLADATESHVGQQSETGLRVYSPHELQHLGLECAGFLSFLESAAVLPPTLREIVIDRAMALPTGPVPLEDFKIIVLMVFWGLGKEPDALILDDLFDDEADRTVH